MQKFNEDGVPISVAPPREKQSKHHGKMWWKFLSIALSTALVLQIVSPLSLLANPFNPYVWAVEFTGGGTHQSQAYGLDVDSTYLYNAGTYQGTVSFNGPTSTSNSQRDVYVAKIDPATGIPVWVQTAGSNNIDEGWDVAVDDATGDVYASGRFRNQMFLFGSSVSITATGTATGGQAQGDFDAFVYKLDTNGAAQWGVGFGDTTGQDIVLASAFGAGGIHTTGRFIGTADFDPGAGTTNLTSDDSGDMFVYKLDTDGNYVWADNLTALSGTGGQGITVDGSGNVYTVGYFRGAPQNFNGIYQGGISGGRDVLIVKHDSAGTVQWARGFGGPEQGTGRQDVAFDVAVDDATGDIYVTGTFREQPDFDPDIGFVPLASAGGQDVFVLSMDSNGNLKWAKSVGGAGDEEGRKIALDSTNGVYISGFFTGTVDFDPDAGSSAPLTSNGDNDVFVLVLDKMGNYVSVNQFGGANAEESLGLAVDNAATPSIYTSGSFFGPGDFDPDPNNVITLNGSPFVDGFIARLSSNQTPIAVDDEFTVNEDAPTATFDLLENGDSDPDSAPVSIISIGMPDMGGTAVVSGTTGVDYTPAPDFFGTEVFTYTITDGAPFGFATAVVTMTVTGVNDDPLAVDDIETTVEDTPITLNVTANDFDHVAAPAVDDGGQILQIANVGGTSNGGTLSLTGSPPTQVVYTPAQDFVGTDVFTYTLSDSNGGFDTGTVTVTMSAINDTPLAVNDTYTLSHPLFQEPLLPLVNDSDVEGDTLAIITIGTPSNGGIVVADAANPTSQINYTPQPTFLGTETITYTISDGNTTSTATIAINILAPNTAPTAMDDTPTVAEDSTTAIAVLGNDADPENDTLSISAVGVPDSRGAAAINGMDIDYTPAPDFVGTEIFTYTISDGNGGSDSATVTVTVDNVNDDPTAASDTYTVTENSALTALAVTANDDIAPDTGEMLTVSTVGVPDNGGTVAANGTNVDYIPAAGFFGTETFTYTIGDGNGGSATATVTVTVIATETPNSAPVAVDDTATVAQDGVLSASDVLANDSDPDGDTIMVDTTPVTDVTNGTLIIDASGLFTYTPAAGFAGMDSFVYQIDDGNGLTATATVNITVTSTPNSAPVAVDDTASVVQDTVLNGASVLANDSDPDNDTLTVSTAPVTSVANGTLVLNADGTYTYTPTAGFVGTDTFEYEVDDGNGMTATSMVAISVTSVGTPPNNAPQAVDDASSVAAGATLTGDVLVNDTDADGDSLSVSTTPVTDVSNGVLILNADGTFSYTPNAEFDGTDSFEYQIGDGNGGSDTATVTITVIAPSAGNTPPISSTNGVVNATASQDGALNGSLLAGISDPDGDPLSVDATPVENASSGQLVINADGTYDYVPNPGFAGTDSFTYRVEDSQGGTLLVTVNISVTAAETPPPTNTNNVYLPTVIK